MNSKFYIANSRLFITNGALTLRRTNACQRSCHVASIYDYQSAVHNSPFTIHHS